MRSPAALRPAAPSLSLVGCGREPAVTAGSRAEAMPPMPTTLVRPGERGPRTTAPRGCAVWPPARPTSARPPRRRGDPRRARPRLQSAGYRSAAPRAGSTTAPGVARSLLAPAAIGRAPTAGPPATAGLPIPPAAPGSHRRRDGAPTAPVSSPPLFGSARRRWDKERRSLRGVTALLLQGSHQRGDGVLVVPPGRVRPGTGRGDGLRGS